MKLDGFRREMWIKIPRKPKSFLDSEKQEEIPGKMWKTLKKLWIFL